MLNTNNNKLVYGSKLLFWVLIINIFISLDTVNFWIGFFYGYGFPIEELKPLINNFEGYYAWERSFVVPDTIVTIATLYTVIRLFKNQGNINAILTLGITTGAWLFLGVLDFTYGITNGMYTLGHEYSNTLLGIGVGLPIMGSFTLWSLFRIVNKNRKGVEKELMNRDTTIA